MTQQTIRIRFYGGLNTFLRKGRRRVFFSHKVNGRPTVGDLIESLGVPHTEVARICVGRRIRSWRYHVREGDCVLVWPRRTWTEKRPRFILDVHLGKLARYMRLVGLDTLYANNYSDQAIVEKASRSRRIILTRDVGLLKHKRVKSGYWLRNMDPKAQLSEVFLRFALKGKAKPFSICLECNGKLRAVAKEEIEEQIPPKTGRFFQTFYRCSNCRKIYWAGSHYARMKSFLETIL